MLRSYFDGSKTNAPTGKRAVTLGGFVSRDDTWAEFEGEWNGILKSHEPVARYMHMKEALFLRDGFDEKLGWTHDTVLSLLKKLLEFVYQSRWHGRLYGTICTVDLNDYDRAENEGNLMPNLYRICAHASLGSVLKWRARELSNIPGYAIVPIASIDVFFDRNEAFLRHLRSIWERHRKHDRLGWDLINSVVPIEMKNSPPLQFADMLAWAKNRSYVFGDY